MKMPLIFLITALSLGACKTRDFGDEQESSVASRRNGNGKYIAVKIFRNGNTYRADLLEGTIRGSNVSEKKVKDSKCTHQMGGIAGMVEISCRDGNNFVAGGRLYRVDGKEGFSPSTNFSAAYNGDVITMQGCYVKNEGDEAAYCRHEFQDEVVSEKDEIKLRLSPNDATVQIRGKRYACHYGIWETGFYRFNCPLDGASISGAVYFKPHPGAHGSHGMEAYLITDTSHKLTCSNSQFSRDGVETSCRR